MKRTAAFLCIALVTVANVIALTSSPRQLSFPPAPPTLHSGKYDLVIDDDPNDKLQLAISVEGTVITVKSRDGTSTYCQGHLDRDRIHVIYGEDDDLILYEGRVVGENQAEGSASDGKQSCQWRLVAAS